MLSNTLQTIESIAPVLLSPVEGILWRIDETSAGALRVAVLFRLDGCIEADFLAAALQQIQRRHPKLRAVVTEGDDGRLRYHFDQIAPPIPFEITDYNDRESPWREETRRLLQIGFPPAGPLIAVSALRSRSQQCTELLLTAHHAIADGMSAIMLIDDLLTEYAKAEAHLKVPPRPTLPVVTPARAKPSGGWLGRLRLFRRFLRIQREERRSRQTSLPEARDIPPQSQWVHWIFSQADTLALVRRCRKEQASLSGALVAAACCGLMDCLPVSEALFKCQFPLNLRDALEGPAGPVTPQDLGCFVSVMNAFYQVGRQQPFWDLARRAHQDLQAFVQQGGPSFYYNLAAATGGRLFARAAPKLMPSAKRVTFLSTNYGVLNIRDEYGSLRPLGCTLIFKNDTMGPSLILEALVMGQRLNIGLAAGGLEPVFWEQFQAAVRRHLDAAAGAPKTASSRREPRYFDDQDEIAPQRMSVAPHE